MDQKQVFIYENWSEDTPILFGKLFVDHIKGNEVYSFEYDKQYLKSNSSSFNLDPDLSLYTGRQYTPINKTTFGIFADSAPDRWGRTLMKRREAIVAKNEDRKARKLTELDYLLGVYDESRIGALRFSLCEGGHFLSDDKFMSAPPWTSLRALEDAARKFENDETSSEDKWINQLLGPGSSLGGARPKASIKDVNGELWIAKFPSKNDTVNSGAWEKVAHELALLCELNVPESKLEKFSKNGDTFLVKRFDRIGKKRIHFSSAMTMLGKQDGEASQDGTGYLDIVSFINSYGISPKNDLEELWKRIVFNMAISNTDDHLRNHGFILKDNGWILSPLFDVNPIPYGNNLSLNVSENDNSIDLNLAFETAKYYGINNNKALVLAKEIINIVQSNWEKIAKKYDLSRNSIEYMRPAFSLKI